MTARPVSERTSTLTIIVAALALGVAAPASAIEVGVGIGGIGASVGIGGHGSNGSSSSSSSGSDSSNAGSAIAADVSVNETSVAAARVGLNGKRGAKADVALGRVSDGRNGAVIGLTLGRAPSQSAPSSTSSPTGTNATSASLGGQSGSTATAVSFVGHVVKARDGTVLGIVEQSRPGPGKTVDMRMQVASTLGLSAPVLTLRVTPTSAKDGVLALNMNEAQFKRQVQ